MKKLFKLLILFFIVLLQIIPGCTFASTAGKMKCALKINVGKDSEIIYYGKNAIAAYSKASNKFLVVDTETGVKHKEYTVNKNCVLLKSNFDCQDTENFRLISMFNNQKKLYTYYSLNVLTGKQIKLIETSINFSQYSFSVLDNGKILTAVNPKDNTGIIVNGEINKCISGVKIIRTLDNTMCILNGAVLEYVDLNKMETHEIVENICENQIQNINYMPQSHYRASVNAGSCDSFLLFIDNNILKMFSLAEKRVYVIKNMSGPTYKGKELLGCLISMNYQKSKFAIITNIINKNTGKPSDNNEMLLFDIKSKNVCKSIKINNSHISDIIWDYDGNEPIMVANEGFVMASQFYSDMYAIENNTLKLVDSGPCTEIFVTKQDIEFISGYTGEDVYGVDGVNVKYNIKTGEISKNEQDLSKPDQMAKNSKTFKPLRLKKEKDLTITKNLQGYIDIQQKDGYYNSCLSIQTDNNYVIITKPKNNICYFYDEHLNKLYCCSYLRSIYDKYYVLKYGKYVSFISAGKDGNRYLEVLGVS